MANEITAITLMVVLIQLFLSASWFILHQSEEQHHQIHSLVRERGPTVILPSEGKRIGSSLSGPTEQQDKRNWTPVTQAGMTQPEDIPHQIFDDPSYAAGLHSTRPDLPKMVQRSGNQINAPVATRTIHPSSNGQPKQGGGYWQ